MNRRNQIFILVAFIVGGLISCTRQQPQLPSNKGNVADKNIKVLLDINQKLAIKEDSLLQEFASQDKAYQKNELGFWYKINKVNNDSLLKNKTRCKFICKVTLLNGKVIQSETKQVIIGKKQVVMGLEEGLKLLHKGESATFIIPWYLGYGMKGMEPLIPPYTSLIFYINLIN